MKTKYFFLAALAATALASCTSDDFIADAPPVDVNEGMTPILFTSNQKAFTRADYVGAEAAEMLGNQFVVFGYKGTKTATPGTTVFDNYLVKYFENSANTTESNSDNWEYVLSETGVPIKHAVDNGIVAQTIKYWDYSQPQYDFFAWSTGSKAPIYEGTPAAGEVLVSEMAATAATDPATGLANAYTFTGTADALKDCYISDLVTVYKGTVEGNPTYNVVQNGYQLPVTLKFRQLGTKVRIGIYETVPGYSVKDVKFYTKDGVLDADANDNTKPAAGQIVDDATIFTTVAGDIYTQGTYTVSFPTVDSPTNADNNQAHISFVGEGDQTTIVDWGTLDYTYREKGESEEGKVYLGRTSNTATFAGDAADNYYVVYLPNETGTNLNLRIDFTLEAIDGGGEEIFVKNAKAQVPSIYTTWKPGFAYTYLFKISDKTNGRTGVYDPTQADDATINSDPAGLYPITFDALVVNAEENATQETITTVMTPSITTYQQNSTVVNDDEYQAATGDIFVTVNEGDALVTFTETNAALYTIEAGMTEAEVVDALTYQDDDAAANTIKGRSGKVLTEAEFELTNSVEFGADGNAIAVGDNQALRFEPTATTYAFVYTKKAPVADNNVEKFQPVTKAAGDDVKGLYRFGYKASSGDAQKGVKYFSKENDVYAMVAKPFIGQGVGNLFLDEDGEESASGNAVTGTDYYYTIDNGLSYIKAHNVAWAEGCLQGLYEEGATTGSYEATQDTEPVDGKAYYFHDTTNDVYIYCVFTPQQTDNWFELDEAKVACGDSETAIDGQTYFDKYTKNDGEYYAKVIKVQ